MITKRPANDRGPTNIGWLKSMHSFSFGHYYDPANMGYGPLRVINDDHIAGGGGFGTHPHDNMEIITYVLNGELAHKDSMGNGSTIRPGDIQVMSAGTGVAHSEFNKAPDKPVHLLQIWIQPNQRDAKPTYQQASVPANDVRNTFKLVISPDGAENSLTIRQDARMFAGKFEAGGSATFKAQPGRRYWLQVATGDGTVNGQAAVAGDGFAIADEAEITLSASSGAEVLLFDLP